MELSSLAGNSRLKELLSHGEEGRGLSHAYIISGPAGSGRHTLAGLMAAALVCQAPEHSRPCGKCAPCRKAAGGIHPDIIKISGPDGKPISVDQVRQLRSDAHIRPNEAQRKIYLLEQAERMNQPAQNAMLKLLEEGPPYAAFLLLAENGSALLPTVRSRCEGLSLAPVSVPQAEQWLAARFPNVPPQERRQAALDCQGLLGRAVERLAGGGEDASALDGQAEELVEACLAGDEMALMEGCVPLEKWDRQQLIALLDRMTALLGQKLPSAPDRRRVLRAIRLVDELRRAADLNVGPGPLAGWLCAGLSTPSDL